MMPGVDKLMHSPIEELNAYKDLGELSEEGKPAFKKKKLPLRRPPLEKPLSPTLCSRRRGTQIFPMPQNVFKKKKKRVKIVAASSDSMYVP